MNSPITVDHTRKIQESIESEYDVRVFFLTLSGSHLWGLSTPDSDIDLRGYFVKPTRKILSLDPGKDTIEMLNLNGNIDLQLYEIEKMCRMLLANNGNIVEMLLSPKVLIGQNLFLRGVASRFVTKSLYNYYEGYYHSQRKRASQNRGSKALIYTYREIMNGIWVMKYGEIVYNFHELLARFEEQFNVKYPLLHEFMRDPTVTVGDEKLRYFEGDWEGLVATLREERDNSKLPETYPKEMRSILDSYLYDTRLQTIEF